MYVPERDPEDLLAWRLEVGPLRAANDTAVTWHCSGLGTRYPLAGRIDASCSSATAIVTSTTPA